MTEQTIYRVAPPSAVILRDEDDGDPTVEGMVVPYGQWSEVDSIVEGHFLERFAHGSLRKTFSEGMKRVKGFFEHGQSRMFDRTPIMEIREAWETDQGAFFRAKLLNGLPEWMVDGLRRGLYGVSLGATPVKVDTVRYPKRSAHNPDGIEERTYRELRGNEFSLTPFPHYPETTAVLRSITDELMIERLVQQPDKLLQILRETQEAEPTHSEPAPDEPESPDAEPEPEPEDDSPEETGSRDTQPETTPTRDWLAPTEEKPEWLLP